MNLGRFRGTFLRVLKCPQIKDSDLISGGTYFAESLNYFDPLVCFNFKSLMDTIFSFLIRFECILHDWGVLFTESWNFYKLKMGDLISVWNQFCKKSELFVPCLFISILKVLWIQIHHHSLDCNGFCMIHGYFSQSIEMSTNYRGGT